MFFSRLARSPDQFINRAEPTANDISWEVAITQESGLIISLGFHNLQIMKPDAWIFAELGHELLNGNHTLAPKENISIVAIGLIQADAHRKSI